MKYVLYPKFLKKKIKRDFNIKFESSYIEWILRDLSMHF